MAHHEYRSSEHAALRGETPTGQQASTRVTAPESPPRKGTAIAAIVLGALSVVVFIPILNLILGIIGIFLAREAAQRGIDGLPTAALVVSIVGTVFAAYITGYVILAFL